MKAVAVRGTTSTDRRRRLGPAALEHIKKLVDEAPPLTADQRAVLGMLLRRGAQRATTSPPLTETGQRAA